MTLIDNFHVAFADLDRRVPHRLRYLSHLRIVRASGTASNRMTRVDLMTLDSRCAVLKCELGASMERITPTFRRGS